MALTITRSAGMLLLAIWLILTGLAGLTLVATEAVIGLSVLIAKTIVYGGYDVLTPDLFLIGCLLGLCMIPGTYLARWLLERMRVEVHTVALEVIIVLGAVSFLWRAVAG